MRGCSWPSALLLKHCYGVTLILPKLLSDLADVNIKEFRSHTVRRAKQESPLGTVLTETL